MPTFEGAEEYALVIDPATVALVQAPTSYDFRVANGPPNGQVLFSIDGEPDPIMIEDLDDAGALAGISVAIRVGAAGVYTLRVSVPEPDDTDSVGAGSIGTGSIGDPTEGPPPPATYMEATAAITVAAVEEPEVEGVIVVDPPTDIQPTTGVRRWVLQDTHTGDAYTFEFNPSEMTSPHGAKRIEFAATTAVRGEKIAFEGSAEPVQWQFTGAIFTKAMHDELLYWSKKNNRVWLTDHLGRAWLIYITNYAPIPLRSVGKPWRHNYTVNALIFFGPVVPVSP